MVCGLWAVAHGLWPIAWPAAYGLWHGLRPMAYSMAYGLLYVAWRMGLWQAGMTHQSTSCAADRDGNMLCQPAADRHACHHRV